MTERNHHNPRVGRRHVKRSEAKPTRTSRCGFVTIIVDTNETEKNYFNGLKDTLSNGTQISILRAKKTETIVEFALDYKNGANLPTAEIWLVFDRDELRIFDRLIEQAERHALKVAWSNPCFEIWLHAHLGEMPACNES